VTALPLMGKPFKVVSSRFTESMPQFSPDGRWIAYNSNESGRYEVYVRPFRPEHVAPDGTIMATPIVRTGATLAVGAPVALFRPRIVGSGTSIIGLRQQYDVAPDGRFLINVTTNEAATPPITLLLNWKPLGR
jgi:eukaryotic-like serine/threonine-protein kinase